MPKLADSCKDKTDAVLMWLQAGLKSGLRSPRGYYCERRQWQCGCTSLKWSRNYLFGQLSFTAQRIAVFARAVVKCPDLVIFDGEQVLAVPRARGDPLYQDQGH